jgi:hypothetical protein
MIVGFLSNKLTLRGTEIAMYDYAHFNELLLNNKSIILTRDYNIIKNETDVHLDAYIKFKNRFSVEYYASQSDIDYIVDKYKITHLYIIKAGLNNDNIYSTKCKNLIHCVGTISQPHGDVYSTVEEINRLYNTNYPVVPHMINVYNTLDNMKDELNIPIDAIVFGRYGGLGEFDLNFVYNCIKKILNNTTKLYFIFMNTNIFYKHPNIKYLNGTTDMSIKRKFINTCDAMLHARSNGESYGLSCGEFAICLKPVITYSQSKEKSHINILGDKAVLYENEDQLYNILNEFTIDKYNMENNGYLKYNCENVMKVFDDVYLKS